MTRWWEDKARQEWEEALEYGERLHKQQLRQAEERDRRQLERAKKRIAELAEAKSPYSVVYYIRRNSDGAIKIGFSASLAVRPLLDWIIEAREKHTYHRVQPDSILRLNELRKLGAAAPAEEDLQWNEIGDLLWPPERESA